MLGESWGFLGGSWGMLGASWGILGGLVLLACRVWGLGLGFFRV